MSAARKGKRPARSRSKNVLPPRDGSKQAALVGLLARRQGATVDEIVEALQWQAHTIRAAISTLASARGYAITRDEEGRYRIG